MRQALTLRLGFFLVLLVLLAACGSTSTPVAAPAPTGATAAQRPTAPATAPAAQPSASQPTQAIATQPPAATPPAPTTASATTAEEGIAQGLTPEGYHFLGRADAPVIFQDFSDFL